MPKLNSATIGIQTADPLVIRLSLDALTSETTWLNTKVWRNCIVLRGQEAGPLVRACTQAQFCDSQGSISIPWLKFFPSQWLSGKNSGCQFTWGSIPGLGRRNVDTICIRPPQGVTLHCQNTGKFL